MVVCFNNVSSTGSINPPVSLFKPAACDGVDNINSISNNFGFKGVSSQVTDTFQSTMTPEMVARKKFDALFPNGEINKVYDKINKDFGITNPAKLNFVYDKTSQLGGGFTFEKNEIEMNLYDLMMCDKKIVGVKNGKKIPLVSPKEKLPMFIDKNNGEKFIDTQNKNGSLGFDKLILEDVTPKEYRKFITQKIAHECVHAKQHQILRETEGVGDKEILKAWTHKQPENMIEEQLLNRYADRKYQTTPWAEIGDADVKFTKDSPVSQRAQVLLEAIRNYPPVTSPEYTKNPLEREAFDVSAAYVSSIAA